jgi:hypothetical protein
MGHSCRRELPIGYARWLESALAAGRGAGLSFRGGRQVVRGRAPSINGTGSGPPDRSPGNFDTAPDFLKQLKAAGVHESIILAMVRAS